MWPPSCMQYLQVSCIKTRKHKLMYSSKKTLINVHVYHLYLWSKHFFLDIKANNICKTCYSVMNSFWHCELSGPGVWKLKPPNIREPFALNNLASFYTLSHFPHSQLSVWVKKLPCDKKNVIALYAHIHVLLATTPHCKQHVLCTNACCQTPNHKAMKHQFQLAPVIF